MIYIWRKGETPFNIEVVIKAMNINSYIHLLGRLPGEYYFTVSTETA